MFFVCGFVFFFFLGGDIFCEIFFFVGDGEGVNITSLLLTDLQYTVHYFLKANLQIFFLKSYP